MLGLLYLILCFTVGWAICSYAFPNLNIITQSTYDKRKISVSSWLLLFPAWFLTGTLIITWLTYLTAVLFSVSNLASVLHRNEWVRTPLVPANLVSMSVACIITAFFAYKSLYHKRHSKKNESSMVCSDERIIRQEFIFTLAVTLLAGILMWTTFYVKGGVLYVGSTVFSDFSPHLGMIRSFSYGNNFPTQYSHYAGQDIRYHIMFQFLVGNLEFLGLRIDYAFNLPSMISFISAFLLLYLLAVKITGKRAVGFLACLFFAFRSSKALFTYIAELPANTNVLRALEDNVKFIGKTPHEDWGLWNLNVYCNQRHLSFGLAVMFFLILLFLPYLYEMAEAMKNISYHNLKFKNSKLMQKTAWIKLNFFFLSKEGWLPKNIKLAVASGIMLGCMGFFHGSVVIASLMILALFAVFSVKRLDFLITAVIAMVLVSLQTHFFIHGTAVAPKLFFGFIADNKSLFGVASYLDELLGILPIVLIIAFCFVDLTEKWIMLAFSLPLIFSFFVSLTVDVTVNHKYIMMSCILLGIFAAALIVKMFEIKNRMLHIAAILLIFMLTATGIYDFMTVVKANTRNGYVTLNLEDPTTDWIHKNSDSKDIFLTSNITVNQLVFGGAMLYEGWQYYAWSAGYDTAYRDSMVKGMYEADTPELLDQLVKKNKIRFIVISRDNRESKDYLLNENNIKQTYQCVYTIGSGKNKLSIYDTKKLITEE